MFNPTWLYSGAVYAAAIWLARRGGIDIPRRIGWFFYSVVLVFFWLPLTQDYVNFPVDFLGTLPPWSYLTPDHRALNRDMNDLVLQIVPWAHQVRESWKSLSAPLWNNFSGSGYPLLASAQSSAFSPLRILGLPLSLGHAIAFESVMKILVAQTFMFLWCRRRGASEIASVFGAIAYGYSTFTIVWLHFPVVTTSCLIPAVFYLVDLMAERVTFPRVAAGGVVWASMLFGGHPETVAHTFFFAGLYVAWIVLTWPGLRQEGAAIRRFAGGLFAALAIAGLLAAPLLVPFAEAITKSKRYAELAEASHSAEVPFSDWRSAALLVNPHFWGEIPHEWHEPAHPESVSGFCGYLSVAAWFGLLAHLVATRNWRSREAFLVLCTLFVLGVLMSWPGIRDVFHFVFQLAANARIRSMLVLFLAIQLAFFVDLLRTDRRSALIGIGAGSVLMLVFLTQTWLPTAYQRDVAGITFLPSIAVLAMATAAALFQKRHFIVLALLVAVIAELWEVGRDWNPAVPDQWAYPRTPIITALDEIASKLPREDPFRIVGTGAVLFPNLSAVYGYEDVRAHDPMANGRYIGMLRVVTGYDSSNYFATWTGWEKRFIDYLNVRYILAATHGELPPRYRLVYQGIDGRIFENPDVLPRFFATRNVIIDFNGDTFIRKLSETEEWSNTAFLDRLDVESPVMRGDLFDPRPPDSPLATARIVEAHPTDYRIHVSAPRWSIVVSSVPWWPGWKVTRNGSGANPIRVNGAFLGFAVPPGETDVRVRYDPWTFRAGWIIALATIAGLVAFRFRRRTWSAHAAPPQPDGT